MSIYATWFLITCSWLIHPEFPCDELRVPDCPVAVASFGAAVNDGYLYVYGGNAGTAHSFSKEGQNREFRRIQLVNGSSWESLGDTPLRQGMALVAYNGSLYRMGGFEAMNEAGQPQDLVSHDDFQKFDPKSQSWSEMPPLPEPRSSFDAVVLDGALYVIGGWRLNGKGKESDWHHTAWKFQLEQPNGKWEPIAPPPPRRANAVAQYAGKVYLLGGMDEHGSPITDVSIYDPKSNQWSDGPAIPGDEMQGFGVSAFNVGDRLIASSADGQILQLEKDGTKWKKIHQMENGRFFHRLVAIDDQRFAILCGTTSLSGKIGSVLIFDRVQLEKSAP